VRDRVVQQAALLILEPIFESDFLDSSYGFRPKRDAHDALAEIRGHLGNGYQAVYDADLKSYFDTIEHRKLLACVRYRIADRSVVKLIRLWLEAKVVEPGEGGPGRKNRCGTPQGGVITPLTQRKLLVQGQNMAHGNFLCLGVHDHFLHQQADDLSSFS